MTLKKQTFEKQEAVREKQVAALRSVLADLRSARQADKPPAGLDHFFADKPIRHTSHLARAFEIINRETDGLLAAIAKKHGLLFPEKFPGHPDAQTGTQAGAPPEYSLIDRVIGTALQQAAPLLAAIHPSFAGVIKIEDYTRVPAIWELACADQLISFEEIEQFSPQDGHRPEARDIDEELVASKRLSRTDISRLVVKQQFIRTRLDDKQKARQLIAQNRLTPEQLAACFSEQARQFKTHVKCTPLKTILLEKKIIEPEAIEAIFGSTDVPESTRKPSIPPEQPPVSEHGLPIELIVSSDGTTAWIRNRVQQQGKGDIARVKQLLNTGGVVSGVIEDDRIKQCLARYLDIGEKWVVAESGRLPFEQDGMIEYCFSTHDRCPGIFKEDGTIDFRDRGHTPFVKKGDLLARKIPPEKQKARTNIFGTPIMPLSEKDAPIKAGKGTQLSADGLELYAAIEGEPCLDTRGVVSVYQELVIKDDVDFETGHIDFNGNVVVQGSIKEGFKVSCVNLIVSEINGGIISTTGDLYVSKGIINARISTLGNIKAKFINKSAIDALGDMTVTREIMESEILVNGQCRNPEGRITSSTISAKMGFLVKWVGTEKSKAATLKPGVNDYIDRAKDKLTREQERIDRRIKALTEKEAALEEENFDLHKKITAHASACERLEHHAARSEKGHRTEEQAQTAETDTEAQARLKTAEKAIKRLLDIQDSLMAQMQSIQDRIKEAHAALDPIQVKKARLTELMHATKGVPIVQVLRHIEAGTRIIGPNTAMVFKQNTGACKILEIDTVYGDSPGGKEMVIQSV